MRLGSLQCCRNTADPFEESLLEECLLEKTVDDEA
jgi:hypothetical protein